MKQGMIAIAPWESLQNKQYTNKLIAYNTFIRSDKLMYIFQQSDNDTTLKILFGFGQC